MKYQYYICHNHMTKAIVFLSPGLGLGVSLHSTVPGHGLHPWNSLPSSQQQGRTVIHPSPHRGHFRDYTIPRAHWNHIWEESCSMGLHSVWMGLVPWGYCCMYFSRNDSWKCIIIVATSLIHAPCTYGARPSRCQLWILSQESKILDHHE